MLALATQLGLANTIFRRNFPDICAELAAIVAAAGHSAGADAYTKIKMERVGHLCLSGAGRRSPTSPLPPS
ncbi:hypothetical protein ACWDG9_41245 [Streptomyces sp. NPDC001073]